MTNCPNIPATGALWVRAPQLWESQQEKRQTRLSFGRQINLASYLPGDNIAFPLEKQKPEISEGGSVSAPVSLVKSLQHLRGSQAGLVPVVEFLVWPMYGAVSLREEYVLGTTPCLGHGPGLLAGATSPDSGTDSPFSRRRCELIVPWASELSLGPVSCE